MDKYKFNKEKLEFVRVTRGIGWWGKKILQFLFVGVAFLLLYYVIFALVFSTEEEKRLARENEIMEEQYLLMQEKLQLLDNTVQNLKHKDREIYRSIFNADPLIISLMGYEESFIGTIDTTRDDIIVAKSKELIGQMLENVQAVKRNILEIEEECDVLGASVKHVPSVVPLKNFSTGQTGASIGKKINPFYKTVNMHTGLDLLGAVGNEIVATASGVVESAVRSKRGNGNTLVIDHLNGYRTIYSHLGDILVRRGQKVVQGDVIARIGLTGMSFAPHLHYEVEFNGKKMDPVNYFFGELSPEQFRDMVAISSNTGQSLD